MDLTIKPEYIENERVTFIADKDEKAINSGGTYYPMATINVDYINLILVRNNKIYISFCFATGSMGMIILDHNKFIHMFDDHRLDNKISDLSNKLDKLSSHVMMLMIAVGALSKDFDGEFP